MPELLEIESYRRLAEGAVHREVAAVDAPDDLMLRHGLSAGVVRDALVGSTFEGLRRIGKVLFFDTDRGHTLALRFGMTGLLELDDAFVVDELEYGSKRRDPRWVRFSVLFVDGGALRLHDARRLGGIELDMDEGRLGVDATVVTRAQLAGLLGSSQTAVKSRLMDQARLAGLGNLLTDDVLWRAGIHPARPAASLSPDEVRAVHTAIRATLRQLGARGGSHLGDLQPHRKPGAFCPRDGAPLERRTIGGRTTYFCPQHQR